MEPERKNSNTMKLQLEQHNGVLRGTLTVLGVDYDVQVGPDLDWVHVILDGEHDEFDVQEGQLVWVDSSRAPRAITDEWCDSDFAEVQCAIREIANPPDYVNQIRDADGVMRPLSRAIRVF